MNQKREPQKRKPIKEVSVGRSYSGEASAYWDFLRATQRVTEEGNPSEDILANPDVLSDEEGLYNRPLSEDGEVRLSAIKEAMESLSPQQKKVVELCGFEGNTLEATAKMLGVKPATVQTLLKRAREKIIRVYEREKRLQ